MQPQPHQPNGKALPKTITGTVIRPFQMVEQEMAGNQVIGIKSKTVTKYGDVVTLPYQLGRELAAAVKFVPGQLSREELIAMGHMPPLGDVARAEKQAVKAEKIAA
jgi:hypothetical protein